MTPPKEALCRVSLVAYLRILSYPFRSLESIQSSALCSEVCSEVRLQLFRNEVTILLKLDFHLCSTDSLVLQVITLFVIISRVPSIYIVLYVRALKYLALEMSYVFLNHRVNGYLKQ